MSGRLAPAALRARFRLCGLAAAGGGPQRGGFRPLAFDAGELKEVPKTNRAELQQWYSACRYELTRRGRNPDQAFYIFKGPVFNVGIPITEDSTVRYILVLGLKVEELLPIVQGQQLDAKWVTTIWDRKGLVLARSREHARYVGHPLPARLQQQAQKVFATTNFDGEPVLRATAVSKPTGWSVAVNAPLYIVQGPLKASLWLWVATTVAAVILTIGLGMFFGRAMAQPLADVARAVRALGRGDRIEASPSFFLSEANGVTQALRKAQQDLEQREAALRASERQLRDAAEAAQFGTHDYDVARNRVQWSPQLKRILGTDLKGDATLEMAVSFIHPADRERVHALMAAILAGRQDHYEFEFRIVRPDGAIRWVMDRGQAIKGAHGRVARVVGVLLDISDLKQAEERRQLVVNELNHRIKNTLAIVQSIASQTLRTTPDPAEFEKAFSARLGSLARAHGLLTDQGWQEAPLNDVVVSALTPFRSNTGRIEIAGPPIRVPATTAITLSLMLHELATNAAKYGALSKPEGRLKVGWKTTEGPDSAKITLRWVETGGPPVEEPQRQGFGSRLLNVSAMQLGGEVWMDYAPSGLRCVVEFFQRCASADCG